MATQKKSSQPRKPLTRKPALVDAWDEPHPGDVVDADDHAADLVIRAPTRKPKLSFVERLWNWILGPKK